MVFLGYISKWRNFSGFYSLSVCPLVPFLQCFVPFLMHRKEGQKSPLCLSWEHGENIPNIHPVCSEKAYQRTRENYIKRKSTTEVNEKQKNCIAIIYTSLWAWWQRRYSGGQESVIKQWQYFDRCIYGAVLKKKFRQF